MTTQRRWRVWLSNKVIDRWLRNGRYFQLNLVSGDHDNPEYRIAQDLRVATDAPVDFAVGVVSAALSAATFITVLWTIGGAPSLTIRGVSVTIPGFPGPRKWRKHRAVGGRGGGGGTGRVRRSRRKVLRKWRELLRQ
jgi:ABC-type uncharacterized transport system fused permease/ATPase subunit